MRSDTISADMMGKFAFFRNKESLVGGGRFWQRICDDWQKDPRFDSSHYQAMFFNISGPLKEFIRQRLNGKKIIVRVDGIYHEKISAGAVDWIPHPLLRNCMRLLFRVFGERDALSELFNIFPRNIGILIKLKLSSVIVFQSEFSRRMYSRYLSSAKKSLVVVNGFSWALTEPEFNARLAAQPRPTRLVTTYDLWRPSKRLDDLVQFVLWCNQTQNVPVHLTILGYRSDRRPANLTATSVAAIAQSGYFSTHPAFTQIDQTVKACFADQHAYATFTYRDNCPNAVIEAMAFGLPVLAMNSGGLPDIVQDAGVLLPQAETTDSHFSSFDRSFDYPPIDFPQALAGLQTLLSDYPNFVHRVRARFAGNLDLHFASAQYLRALDEL